MSNSARTHSFKVKLDKRFEKGMMSITDYLTTLVGLLGLLLFIHYYDVESILRLEFLMWVIIPGFAIYSWVPLAYKMPFYFALNTATLILLFGLPVALAVLVIVTGFCWMASWPIKWWIKAVLTLLMFLGLIVLRIRFFPNLGGHGVARVAGILLMFRSIVYLYEVRYEKTAPSVWLRLNYLLLAPNLIFFLFPIIDYKTFMRGLFAKSAKVLADRGLRWMLLALFQFMLYRILYSYFLPSANEVTDIYSLIQHLFVSYALILRLSAIFHFSVGLVCLFGFDLPPTFNNYFLATSFSELWKRINIYWRDFVMKVFYFPIYFKFKKRNSTAIFLTILIVFFFNWFMHAYQWLWIKGSFLWQTNDMVFWAILGLFLAISAVRQTKTKRKVVNTQRTTPRQALVNSGKILGVFTAMSLLWGFWVSPSISDWWVFMTSIQQPEVMDLVFISLSAIGLIVIGAFLYMLIDRPEWQEREARLTTSKSFFFTCLALPLLFASPVVKSSFESSVSFTTAAIFSQQLNKQDQELVFQGYYDQLIVGNNFSAAQVLAFDQSEQKEGWQNLASKGVIIDGEAALLKEMIPDTSLIFKYSLLKTNSQGLRDQEYPVVKPANSVRIALLGGSMEMGSGVEKEQTFEYLLEQRLNQTLIDSTQLIEVINFAISGIHLPQHLAILNQKVKNYNPDYVIYTAHFNELLRATRAYGKAMLNPERLTSIPYLYRLAKKLKLQDNMSTDEYLAKIGPYIDELYDWGLSNIAQNCIQSGSIPIYLYLPVPGDKNNSLERLQLAARAKEKGFHVIDMYGIFTDIDWQEITIARFDQHPNPKGHKIIADSLFDRIVQDTFLQQKIRVLDNESKRN